MTTYLLNTPILTGYGEWKFDGPISVQQAKALLAGGFQSAIGHQASAQFLSQLLDCNIPANRISADLQVGDSALVLRLKTRLPEGKLLTPQEMQTLPFELGWLQRIK